MEDEWKQDISKLKNYKILESKFSNPSIKDFIDCVFQSNTVPTIDMCRTVLRPGTRVESGGDMRCSGKSELLHLIFPYLHKSVDFAKEELAGSIQSIISSFSEPSDSLLAIYVKRNPEEKLKCLLKHRGIYNKEIKGSPAHYDFLPNQLKDEAYTDIEKQRKTLLPQIYKHHNYIITENINKEEEPDVTDTKICNVVKEQLEWAIKENEGNLISAINMQKRGMDLSLGKDNADIHIKYTEDTIKHIKEYLDKCNQEDKIKLLETLIKKRKEIYNL